MQLSWFTTLIQTDLDEAIPQASQFMENLQALAREAVGPVLSILMIVLGAMLVLRVLRTMIRRTITRFMEQGEQSRRELTLKANTLASVIESAGRLLVILIAGMMVLSQLGQDIAPLIASAGVVGLAIGLGAQSLIKDIIGGFFILFEDQYSVGDVINANGQSGVVEHMSLRRTSLRAIDGSFIVVPNGDIRIVTNLTKEWSRAVIDVDISYDDDVDHAIEVLKDLLKDIESDPEIGDLIMAPAEILGVEALGAYQVTIRLLVKTLPMQQWTVQRELRRRIKRAFSETGVTIPYPHNVTVFQSADGVQQQQATVSLTQQEQEQKQEQDQQPAERRPEPTPVMRP